MATNKPRVNVTLDPDLYAVVRRVAALQGVSMAELLRDLLATVQPMFERLIALGDAFESAPEEVRASLRDAMQQLETDHLPTAEKDAADFVHALTAIAAMGGADPRPVITGVTNE